MSTISTHILDLSRGIPAAGVAVSLESQTVDGEWAMLTQAWTDDDGRVKLFLFERALTVGFYRLVFETGAYFSALKLQHFYPQVTVVFKIEDAAAHYHVPLLLSPFGYSTYRGS